MSTLKVDAIRHNSATSDAITTHSDGTASAKIIDIGGQQLSNRNLLINGDMQISQRNGTASAAVVGNTYTLDRWQSVNDAGSSKFTVQQVTDAPVGFYNSLKMTSSSAYTPTSTEVFGIGQKIEGKNTNWLMFGSSNAKSITISFFVKSSLTGTFNGSVLNADMLRGYPWTYTISSANTWEYKTVTVAGSQDGTWHNDSREGMRIFWNFGSGTYRSGTAGQWSTTQYTFGATGATQAVATNGATLQITGCQVEVGGTATTFEHRSIGEEFARCQRYYQQYVNISAVGYVPNNSSRTYSHGFFFPVEMRAAPTMSITNTGSSNGQYITDGATNRYVSSVLSQGSKTTHMSVSFNISGDLSDYRGAYLFGTENTTYQTTYKIDAEI